MTTIITAVVLGVVAGCVAAYIKYRVDEYKIQKEIEEERKHAFFFDGNWYSHKFFYQEPGTGFPISKGKF